MIGGGAAPLACGGETATKYGPPDGLVDRTPPQPTSTASPDSGGGSSGGGSGSGGSGGSSSGSSSGGVAGDSGSAGDTGGGSGGGSGGGTCAVSWTKDVFPLLESTGSGACGSATCHANGATTPTVLDGNATGTYNQFKAYTIINGKGYITPGDTNTADSTMYCNLVTTSCGANVMPIQPTGNLSTAQKTTIGTWIACGAPQN